MKETIIINLEASIDDCVQSIVEIYHKAAECMKAKSQKHKAVKQEPWWDNECEKLKKEKYKALRIFRNDSNYQNLINYKTLRNRLKDTFRQKNLDFHKRNRDELIASRSNMNLFWRTVKKFRFKKPNISNIIKPERWINHFTELLYVPNLGNLTDNVNNFEEGGRYNDVFNVPFTMSELRNSSRT